MTKRLIFVCALLLPSLAWGTAYTTNNANAQWHTPAHFTPNGIPGAGDTVTIANGHTLTCEAGQTCTIGTAPANDTSTPAIQCQGGLDYSTGVLVNNGTLVYRGTVKGCSGNWVGGPGSTFTHDSNGQTGAHYSWTTSGGGKMSLNGAAGAHVTWNIAPGSGYAGQTGGKYASYATDGLLHATYVDFSDIGAATGSYAWAAGLQGAGSEFTCDHCTWTRCGQISVGSWAADAVFAITNSTHTAGFNATYALFDFAVVSAKTGGSRAFTGNYWENGQVKISAAAANAAIGLTLQDNFGYVSTAGAYTPFMVNGSTFPSFSGTLLNNNVLWTYVASTTGFPSIYLPAGNVNRFYSLYSSWMYPSSCSTVNYHPLMIPGGASVNIDQLISEIDCGGPSAASDGIQVSDASATATVTLTNSITLPGADGIATSVFSYGTHTATAPVISGHNNTLTASNSTGACGFGTDSSAGAPGLFGDIKDNIFWQPASGAGCASGSATAPNGMYAGVTDYNATWNITGTYYKGGSAVYSATPGTHDHAGDPQFVDATRNFLKWCKSLDDAINTWDDCRARFAAHAAGFTPSALIDYVRAGFKPQAAFVKTMSSAGSWVGAVQPDAGARRRQAIVP